jgi:hypothetical protein
VLKREDRLGEYHSGAFRLASAQAKAERIITEELARLGWAEEEPARRRKNDAGKMGIAVRLRRETTLTVKAIAARVHLGTSYTANKRLHQAMKTHQETSRPSNESLAD